MAGTGTEFELVSPPTDGTSSLVFSPGPANYLLVGSWDQHVRLYDVGNNSGPRHKLHAGCPVLDVCFASPVMGFSAGLDGSVKAYDFNLNSVSDIGVHEAGVKCVEYSTTNGVLISGSWDKTIKLWDSRTKVALGTYMMPDKVYSMSTAGDKLVVGCAGRHVQIFDLRNMGQVEQRRESSLKYQTRCIAMNPAGDSYSVSSIEGRVAVEWVDSSPQSQKRKFAFKCHRVKVDSTDTIYPVNAIAYHSKYGTFATGGCDGVVNIWDPVNRKRICQLHRYPTSVASLAFNHDGSMLAIASSYTYEEGEKDHPADAIYVHHTSDSEVKPK